MDFGFAAAVAWFAQILDGTVPRNSATLQAAHDLAAQCQGNDEGGYRQGFLDLVEAARTIVAQHEDASAAIAKSSR